MSKNTQSKPNKSYKMRCFTEKGLKAFIREEKKRTAEEILDCVVKWYNSEVDNMLLVEVLHKLKKKYQEGEA